MRSLVHLTLSHTYPRFGPSYLAPCLERLYLVRLVFPTPLQKDRSLATVPCLEVPCLVFRFLLICVSRLFVLALYRKLSVHLLYSPSAMKIYISPFSGNDSCQLLWRREVVYVGNLGSRGSAGFPEMILSAK